MKRCYLAAMALGCSLMTALTASGWQGSTTVGGVKYWYEADDGTKTASITLTEPTDTVAISGAYTVPARVVSENGSYLVTSIAENAFTPVADRLKTVTIPASIETIGSYAFKDCVNLAKVVFEGRTGDDLNYGEVFENTPFFEKLAGFHSHMSMDQADFCIACQQRGSRADNNQYDNKLAFPYEGDTGQKWYGFTPTASGYILVDTWKSDCDLAISAYKVTGLDGNSQPYLQLLDSSTVTAENVSGNVYFAVEKNETYFVCVEGRKAGPRRARGDYTLQWHFGKTSRKVTLNLHGGTLPCGAASFLLPGYASGKTKNSNYSTLGELPVPVRDGFTFGGWYLESGYKTKATATTKIKSATPLHAKWNAKSYTLTLINEIVGGQSVSVKGIPSAAKYKGKSQTLSNALIISEQYACNRSLTISATARPGYAFDRWEHASESIGESIMSALTRHKPTLNITMPPHDAVYAAMYIRAEDDYATCPDGDDAWYLEDGETNFTITATCRTYPKKVSYSATKGLLDDVKQNWRYVGTNVYMTLTANAKAMAKAGVWTYTVTFTTQGGKTASKTITVYGVNKTSAATSTQSGPAKLSGLNTSAHEPYDDGLQVGVKYTAEDWQRVNVRANGEDGWYIKSITGIPGVSWNAGAGALTGVPTKAGTFLATVTVEKAIKVNKKITTYRRDTATAIVVVSPMESWLPGTYKGYTEELLFTEPNKRFGFTSGSRSVTLTIGATGKISVNIDGAKFATTGLDRVRNTKQEGSYVIEPGYYVNAKINGKGTGKDKNKIVWEDVVQFRLGNVELDFDKTYPGYNTRWRKQGNVTLEADIRVWKNKFAKDADGEYKYHIIKRFAEQMAYDGTGKMRVTGLWSSNFYSRYDEMYSGSADPNHFYNLLVDVNEYGGSAEGWAWFNESGTAYFTGYVKTSDGVYHQYKTPVSAQVDIMEIKPGEYLDSYVDRVRTTRGVRERGGWAVSAKFCGGSSDSRALEIVWYFTDDGGGQNPELYSIEGHFWR